MSAPLETPETMAAAVVGEPAGNEDPALVRIVAKGIRADREAINAAIQRLPSMRRVGVWVSLADVLALLGEP